MSLLSESLRTKLIPWSQQNVQEKFVVAHAKMSAAQMPDGVTLVRRKIVGPRVIVKNQRRYGNVRNLIAEWPEANMQEVGCYKLTCVLSGQIDFQVGTYALQCGAGFYLLLPPGLPRMSARYGAEGCFCDTLNITLHSHALQCFILRSDPRHGHMQCPENYIFTAPRPSEIFRIMIEELVESRKGADDISNNLLAAFWKALLREVEGEHYTTPGPIGRPDVEQMDRNADSNFSTELLKYVQTHLTQNLTLEKTAQAMYLSRAQFVRRMRQETGKSFVQYLTDYRMEEAKILLRESSWTVVAISEFLGFRESSYFQKVFRRSLGCTPSEYRHTKK